MRDPRSHGFLSRKSISWPGLNSASRPILARLPKLSCVWLPSAPVSSVFHVEKSENKNQVHYAVRVDERCRPIGKAPVYAYWRDLEDGPKAVSPLLQHEQPAYGLTEPRATEVNESGGEIRIGMRGFPDRALRIVTFAEGGGCRARAYTPIEGAPALVPLGGVGSGMG